MMECHSGLRVFHLDKYSNHRDPTFSWIKMLLSRNRWIEVIDYRCDAYPDGTWIYCLQDLNRFYRGSASLKKGPQPIRSSLVGMTLMKRALADFQCSALLMANHVGTLCELIEGRFAPGSAEATEPTLVESATSIISGALEGDESLTAIVSKGRVKQPMLSFRKM